MNADEFLRQLGDAYESTFANPRRIDKAATRRKTFTQLLEAYAVHIERNAYLAGYNDGYGVGISMANMFDYDDEDPHDDHPASEPRLRVFTDEDSGDGQCSQPFYWFEVSPDTFLWAQSRGEARLLCQNHVEVTHSLQEIKSMFSNVKEYFGEV